jgi:hypothetical protein
VCNQILSLMFFHVNGFTSRLRMMLATTPCHTMPNLINTRYMSPGLAVTRGIRIGKSTQ